MQTTKDDTIIVFNYKCKMLQKHKTPYSGLCKTIIDVITMTPEQKNNKIVKYVNFVISNMAYSRKFIVKL